VTVIATILNYKSPPQKKLQGITMNAGLTFSVGDATLGCAIGIEQDN
jgi:hypothetical protein